MNNDATTSALSNQLPTQEALQNNLINALTRLQHTVFEKEFLDDGVALNADTKPEAFFGFGIGRLQFMVAASCFCEVFVDTAIAAIPNSPSCLVGLSNIRGVLMPVFQIHSTLDIQLVKKPIIFAVGKGDSAVGLLIDSLPVSLSLAAYQREKVSRQDNALLQQLVNATYFSNQSHWLLLNGNTLGAQLLAMTNRMQKSNTH